MNTNTVLRRALEDRILAALRDEGPLTTGRIRKLTGPHMVTVRPSPAHGNCPSCQCVRMQDLSRYAGPTVRAALKRLAKEGMVVELVARVPNNRGGNVWLLLHSFEEVRT